MPGYRAVIFDFFGTLTEAVRRGPLHTAVARILGCDPMEFLAMLDHTYYARARGELGTAEETLRWICAEMGIWPSETQLSAASAARREAIYADIRLRPDAVSTLWSLRQSGLRTAVVSDCTHELPEILSRLPIDPLLDARVFSVELGICKPAPAMFRTAAALVGVPPEDCLYLGDGGSQELTGASAVGMTAVRLNAPDLADHLVFAPDTDWPGTQIPSLRNAVNLAHQVPQPA